jgi:hypothetical protein
MYLDKDYENIITSRYIESFMLLALMMRGYKKEHAEILALKLSLYYLDLVDDLP